MFSVEERDRVLARVLELARSDPRVTAGALIGSMAGGAVDRWSDIDVTFGIVEGVKPETILDDWREVFERELGALHYWDLPSGASLYRVFLLPSGLEIDVSATPQPDFGARGPRFQSLFGDYRKVEPPPQPGSRFLIGLCWHHALHARVAIERGKPWLAEFWTSALRDHTLELACMRLGEDGAYGRGFDRLPEDVTGPQVGALVRSLDEPELRRALSVATACFITELETWDPELCARLKPTLGELVAP
jgi:hypothetical protein